MRKGVFSKDSRTSLKAEPWIHPVDSLTLLYQLVMMVLIGAGNLPLQDKARLWLGHSAFFMVLLSFLWLSRSVTVEPIPFLRKFYPLLVMVFFYKEIGLLVHQYFEWDLDEWLFRADGVLGYVGMSVWNFQQFYPPHRLLNELFNAAYGFYFLLIPLCAIVLFQKGTTRELRTFVFSIAFTFYLHYLLFMFLPAESPRFFLPGLREALRGYWVSDLLQSVVEKNAFPGGSFPSSHIAASVVCLGTLRHFEKWRVLVLFLTLGMFAGTIYGRYHYFVDVLAGLGVGLACSFLAPWLERKWPWVYYAEGNVRHDRAGEALN